MRDLKSSLSQPGSFCNESFIGRGGRLERSTISLSFFGTNRSLRDLFSFIKFDHAKDKESVVHLYMLFDDSIPFSIHSIIYSFELKSSFAHSNSSLRESISLGSDEFIWTGSSRSSPTAFE